LALRAANPSEGLLTAQYTNPGRDRRCLQYIPFNYTSTGALNHTSAPEYQQQHLSLGTQPFLRMSSVQYRANLVYDFDQVEVTALGGYDHSAYIQGVDQTLSRMPRPESINGCPRRVRTPSTVSCESAPGSGPFQWQVGGFYFSETSHLLSGDVSRGTNGANDMYFGFSYYTPMNSKPATRRRPTR